MCSSSAQKYFRRGARLNWPEGAVSRESIRAVKKLGRLKVSVPSIVLFYLCLSYLNYILNWQNKIMHIPLSWSTFFCLLLKEKENSSITKVSCFLYVTNNQWFLWLRLMCICK
ncbi:hypothetical protein ABZP36_016237 [Zizania latifolia]